MVSKTRPSIWLWGPVVVAASVTLSTCVSLVMDAVPAVASPLSREDVETRLQGSWLREYGTEGVKARRILTLGPHGKFHEQVQVKDAAGNLIEQVHEGTWLYDGTNLKRKYTVMNGKPPSRLNLPFATFQIEFVTRNEFVGTDHIHGHQVRYERATTDER